MARETVDVQPVEQPTQLPGRHLNGSRRVFVPGPTETLTLQASIPQPEAVTLPKQNLELVAAAVAEHEQAICEGVLLQHILQQDGQDRWSQHRRPVPLCGTF